MFERIVSWLRVNNPFSIPDITVEMAERRSRLRARETAHREMGQTDAGLRHSVMAAGTKAEPEEKSQRSQAKAMTQSDLLAEGLDGPAADMRRGADADAARKDSAPATTEVGGAPARREPVAKTEPGPMKAAPAPGPPSPAIKPIKLEGNVGVIGPNRVTGWVWNPAKPDEPLLVSVIVNGEIVDIATADVFREHLLKKGKGNGKHGFVVNLPGTGPKDAQSLVCEVEEHLYRVPISPNVRIMT